MRVLWPHPFSPDLKNASVFMSPLVEPLQKMGVEVELFYIGAARNNPLAAIKVFFDLRKAAASSDIVHAQYGSLCGLVAAFLPGRKIISLRGSDMYPVSVGPFKFRFHLMISRLMTAIALPFYQRVVVMSNDMKRILTRDNAKRHVTTITDGIDLNLFTPGTRDIARERLGIDQNGKYILFTTLHDYNPVKRKYLAQAAVSVAQRKYPDVKILMPVNVNHEEMVDYMNASNLSLITSTHEGWPNCIKESLACNVPFVSTDVSDLREVAARNPSCKVVTAADPELLGQAIVEVLEDNKPVGDLRGEVQSFEIHACAASLKSLYEALLAAEA